MKKAIRTLLLILIFCLALLSSVSCGIFADIIQDEPHSCDYFDDRVVSYLGCTTDGVMIRSCLCGRETTVITPATGHLFTDWEITSESSCTAEGSVERVCTQCELVEKHETARTSHNYDIIGEQVGEAMVNRYTCLDCGSTFTIDSGLLIPPEVSGTAFVNEPWDIPELVIISVGDESYIKENLRIYELSSYHEGEIDYSLTELENGEWLISSSDCLEGKSYIVERDGGIFFKDFGHRSLIFTIKSQQKHNITLTEDIIYIAALEKESPGYFPYGVEFSDGSGSVFLSLEKADGLSVGDLICIGDASSDEDVLAGVGNSIFGRIQSITRLTDGRSLIMLSAEGLSSVFDELDIHESALSSAEALYPIQSHEAKILATLLGDEDYISTLKAFYRVATELMTLRGLTTTIADFDALIASAALTTDREVMIPEEDGSALTARAEVRLTVAIPTYLNAEEIGEIAFTVCYSATLTESTITLSLNSEDAPSLDLFAKVENAMELLAYVDVSYTEEAGLLLRESESGIYHMPGCKNIAGKATAVSHIALLEEKSPVLCNECNPLSFVHSLLVTDDEHYHIPTCKALGTDKIAQSLRETSPHLLMADGLTPCPDCIDENLPEGDLEARLEKAFSALAENEDTALRGNANMAIGVFNATLSGIDRQRLELSVNLDFITPSSAGESTSEIYTVGYHYRVYNGRMVRYTDTDTDFCRLEFYICGFEVKYE